MPWLTITNQARKTSTRVVVKPDGTISADSCKLCRQRLGTPIGAGGHLGEVGPQLPPEAPGTKYKFVPREDGSALAVPTTVAEAAHG